MGGVEYAARLCPSLTRGRSVLCGCLVLLAGHFAGTIPVVVQPDVSTCHDIARRVVICTNPLHSSTSLALGFASTVGFASTENDRLYQTRMGVSVRLASLTMVGSDPHCQSEPWKLYRIQDPQPPAFLIPRCGRPDGTQRTTGFDRKA